MNNHNTISKKGQKERHLLVGNQKAGQKVQKCAFWAKRRSDYDLPEVRTKTCLETWHHFLQ